MKLGGKVAIVTGGSKGIGRGICLKFSSEGASVVVNYLNSKSSAEEVVEQIVKRGRDAVAIKADVGDYEQVETMVNNAIARYGKIDILVNNAGATVPKTFLKLSREEWHDVLNIHLNGTFNCCKLVLPYMVKQKYGRVINISSGIGLTGYAGYANYCAAKAGIIGLSKTLTKELASKGIYINVVAPGFVPTGIQDTVSSKYREELIAKIPMQRFGTVEEIAEVVTFLAYGGDYINGQVIQVDGGIF